MPSLAVKPRTSRRRSSRVPRTLQCSDPGLSQYYYSRRHSRRLRSTDVSSPFFLFLLFHFFLFILHRLTFSQLPMDLDAVGVWSPWAFLWFCCFMVAPIAYIYILLMLLRDLCLYFPSSVHVPLQTYVPWLAKLADHMNNASRIMDIWCVIEALFFIACKLKIQYLQRKDPLEASLSAAPMMDPDDRKLLWDRMIESEQDDPAAFISGWFFDQPIEQISRYDVMDFICWSMFDGRNQEHLTTEELHELECFLEDVEYRISLNLYGQRKEHDSTTSMGVNTCTDNDSYPERQGEPPESPRAAPADCDASTITSVSDYTGILSQRRPRPAKSTCIIQTL